MDLKGRYFFFLAAVFFLAAGFFFATFFTVFLALAIRAPVSGSSVWFWSNAGEIIFASEWRTVRRVVFRINVLRAIARVQ